MSEVIGAAVRRKVRERADAACEYCLMPDSEPTYPHEPDHIIARKHGGRAVLANLAYACFECNRAKGSDIASYDRSTGDLTALFNPREQTWHDHFRFDRAVIEPLTAVGRVTVALLKLNVPARVEIRENLIEVGAFPPTV